jgi:hypothetical protein
MHTIINVSETVPKVVWFTSAVTNDHILLSKLELSPHIIYVFDKGYNDYKAYKLFSENQTGFITGIKDNAVYNILKQNEIERHIHSGVLQDDIIELAVKEKDNESKLKLRFVKIHLFNYIHLMNFLENPEKDWRKVILKEKQYDLFIALDTT